MYARAFVLFWILHYARAQCDYFQNVVVGNTYYIYSPNYPGLYPAGIDCRWRAFCPAGYNCRLDCSEISLPQSPSCSVDRLLLSRSGDPLLAGAETYCGTGSLSAVSTGQSLSLGLISSRTSRGGRFYCELRAQLAPVTPSCVCGDRRQDRIVGGQETGINEFKSMIGVVDLKIRAIKCGAVIISVYYVLTAAHCLINRTPSNTALVAGEHNVTYGDSPATKAYSIETFIRHPQYDPATYDNDVAIIKTNLPIEFNDRVGPVCLPFKFVNTDLTGKKVTLLGWGTLFPGGPTATALRKVDVDVLNQNTCRSRVDTLTSRQFCTLTPGKDACQDDSGGPSLYTDPATGLLFNVGLISFGRFCASDVDPGVHARITSFLDWIIANAPNNYCIK